MGIHCSISTEFAFGENEEVLRVDGRDEWIAM